MIEPTSDPQTPTERRAVLVWRLAAGERFTTRECADILDMTPQCAIRWLYRISRVTPIYFDDPDDTIPRWQRV